MTAAPKDIGSLLFRHDSKWLLLATVLGFAVFAFLFPKIHPAARYHLTTNRAEALEIARTYLEEHGYNLDQFDSFINFNVRDVLLRYYQNRNLKDRDLAYLETFDGATTWETWFYHGSERFYVRVTGQGEVTAFRHEGMAESERDQPSFAGPARSKLTRLFVEEQNIPLEHYRTIDVQRSQDRKTQSSGYKWERRMPYLGEINLYLSAEITQDSISSWSRDISLPPDFQASYEARGHYANLYQNASQLLTNLSFLIAMFAFVWRLRSGEVDIKNGSRLVLVLLPCALYFGYHMFSYQGSVLAIRQEGGDFLRFTGFYTSLIFYVMFSSLFLFLCYATGDSLLREFWPRKLQANDGLLNGYFFFPKLGAAILRGIALAAIMLAFLVVYFFLCNLYPSFESQARGEQNWIFSSKFSPVFPLLIGLWFGMASCLQANIFTFGMVRYFVKSLPIAIAVTLFLYHPFLGYGPDSPNLFLRLGGGVIPAIATYWFFLRYDLQTVIFGWILFAILPYAQIMLIQPDLQYQISGAVYWAMIPFAAVFGMTACIKGKPLNERGIAPTYVRFIGERKRLKAELDVARSAQMHMLPSDLPNLPGYEFAAFSEPAKEVGGDYYDFIDNDKEGLGIVIGDVSGKGMPAALYMTLVKGIIRAVADMLNDPKEILSKLNQNFHRTSDARTFVTLVYGRLHLESGRFDYARAGHECPLLRTGDGKVVQLNAAGIAAGLEKGLVFRQVMKPETVTIAPGSTLLLYTDGLTDAVNPHGEVYGSERLEHLLSEGGDLSASTLLEAVRRDHREFVGKKEPFDDMTCIIVRRLPLE